MTRARRGVRLQKYVAACGFASRRHAELLITAGLVLVNGKPARLGDSIDPQRDEVTLNGDRLAPPPLAYLALHKPVGFITAVHDTHERLTVIDLLPRRFVNDGVAPVGRLDLETSGLLIMTNDGDLAHRIAHPSHGCRKTYRAEVAGLPSAAALERLATGIVLDDGRTAPADVRLHETRTRTAVIDLVLTEGRKRQVRRMCEAIGHPVITLMRLAIGPVALGDLPPGAWRELTLAEIDALRR